MDKEGLRIQKNSREWNAKHKKECVFFNWWARMEKLDRGKDIYPKPKFKEVEAYREIRKRHYKK